MLGTLGSSSLLLSSSSELLVKFLFCVRCSSSSSSGSLLVFGNVCNHSGSMFILCCLYNSLVLRRYCNASIIFWVLTFSLKTEFL